MREEKKGTNAHILCQEIFNGGGWTTNVMGGSSVVNAKSKMVSIHSGNLEEIRVGWL